MFSDCSVTLAVLAVVHLRVFHIDFSIHGENHLLLAILRLPLLC